MFKKIILLTVIAMLFVAAQTGTAGAGIVTNGNFATDDFTGWTVGGDPNALSLVLGQDDVLSNGYYAQFFTYGAPVTISQVLGTTSGQSYTVSFLLYNSAASPSPVSSYNEFEALWDGTVIQPVHLTNAPGFNWTQFQFTVTGTGSDTLAFSLQQDGSNYNLTDVSADPVPLPAGLLLLGPGLAALGLVRRRIGN